MKKILTLPGLLLLLLATGLKLDAQSDNRLLSNAASVYFKAESTPDWIMVRDDQHMLRDEFLAKASEVLGLSADDELRFVRAQETDEAGLSHARFQQYCRGVKVEFGEFIVHEKNNFVASANGKLIVGLHPDLTQSISAEDAVKPILNQYKSIDELWNDEAAEQALKTRLNDPAASYAPKGELVLCAPRSVFDAEQYKLCWKFDINLTGSRSYVVYIDAKTGAEVNRIATDLNCDPGSAATIFNGTRMIQTLLFNLRDNCTVPAEIHVVNNQRTTVSTFYTEYVNANTLWDGVNSSPAQTMWSAEKAMEYYWNVFTRNFYDTFGGNLLILQDAAFTDANGNLYYSNSGWSTTQHVMRVGTGASNTNSDDWNTVDIIGHELTHAITFANNGLIYQDQPGAVNESLSDIFGEAVERYTLGSNDWLVAAERGTLRSFHYPNDYSQPKYFGQTPFYTTAAADNGGVHTNSGIQNYCFYLMCNGATDTSYYSGHHVSFPAMSFDDAISIVYYASMHYLISTAQFSDSRKAWIAAANTLFGSCSVQSKIVAGAWEVANVIDPVYTGRWCGNVPAALSAIGVLQMPDQVTGCTSSTIVAGTPTVVHASYQVDLLPGFTAPAGTVFTAYINPCDLTGYSRIMHPQTAQQEQLPHASTLERLDDNKADDFLAIPTAFSDQLELKFHLNESDEATVGIYTVDGKLVWSQTVTGEGNQVLYPETELFDPGVYMAVLKSGTRQITKRIIRIN